jgi:hypothetical protein
MAWGAFLPGKLVISQGNVWAPSRWRGGGLATTGAEPKLVHRDPLEIGGEVAGGGGGHTRALVERLELIGFARLPGSESRRVTVRDRPKMQDVYR